MINAQTTPMSALLLNNRTRGKIELNKECEEP